MRPDCRACSILLGLLAFAGFFGCEAKRPADSASATGASPAAKVPESLFLKAAPPGARGVRAVKADAAADGEVVIHGRIGGRAEPFVAGAAMFVLADMDLPACGEGNPDDGCKTPWDYCCEPAERILGGTATIQVVGADGRPVAQGLRGVGGLEPLREVTVVGRVSQRTLDGVLVVSAHGFFVKPVEPDSR